VDFLTTIRIMLARWYVLVPALLATGIAALGVMSAVAPAYQAQGAVVLLGPATNQTATNPTAKNPYLGLSLDVVANVLTNVSMSETSMERLKAKGATAEYEVGTGLNGGPILNVTATSPNEQTALRTAEMVVADIRAELARRQQAQGAPSDTWITAATVTRPDRATKMLGSKIRVLVAVLVLGLSATIGLTFMAESIAEGRRRRAEVDRAAEGWRSAADAARRDRDNGSIAVTDSSVTPARQ
jgi:capsular polysaccharide biosynthesis protein